MEIDKYLPALEAELGEISSIDEWHFDVYDLIIGEEGPPWTEYIVVLDTSPLAKKVQNYGKKMDGLRLFDQADDTSGWRIVQYEITKSAISTDEEHSSEWIFRDMSLHAMEIHPEYFGTFPVPFHTPQGFTLRYRTLANGIYWLETSRARELLAVCFPIWNAELSTAALICGSLLEWDKTDCEEEATPYRFFSKNLSCVPIYELMQTRGEWDGTVIYRPALMNAIWENLPSYAMYLNGQTHPGEQFQLLNLLEYSGVPIMPQSDGKHIVGMYPDTGTEFLLLK